MAVTLKQLAQELGLHHSTVAYALSGKGTVKPATRQRVRDAAAELGYVVNGLARRMRSKHTNTIGLVIPDVLTGSSAFTQQMFRDVLSRGYDSQVVLTEANPDLEDKAVRNLLESRVDGIILHSGFDHWDDVPQRHSLRQVASQGIPTVCYGIPLEGAPFPCVPHPFLRQAEMLTAHLIVQGHARIAWLMPEHESGREGTREYHADGSRRAFAAAGLSTSDVVVVSPRDELTDGDRQGTRRGIEPFVPSRAVLDGRKLMRRAMSLVPRPTAVLCVSDVTAIGAMIEAADMGLKIPGDVAVAASSRTIAADLAPTPLTTADVPSSAGVRLVLDVLMARIAEHAADGNGGGSAKPAPSISPEPELVVGRSTQA